MDSLLMPLTQLVIHTHRPDIQTADALLAKMLGDQVGGRMLARLLYWFPRSVKVGGWVYKSWRDWSAECALSQAQIKRIHHTKLLEQFGISRRLMKANGAPTPHYLIDLDQFLHRVAAFLGLAFEQVQTFFRGPTSVLPTSSHSKPEDKPQPSFPVMSDLPSSLWQADEPVSTITEMPDTSTVNC